MIHITNLSYSLKSGKIIFEKINLKIEKGSIFGLLGPNGSGKSTLFKQILGINRIEEGNIHIKGYDMEKSDKINILKSIGSLVENPSLYPDLTASDHLKMRCNVFQTDQKYIEETLKLVKLDNLKQQKTKTFSLGMKQKLGIAMALVTQPEIVFLDEPLNGLDPDSVVDIRNLIRRLNKERGVTFIISSHILSEMELIASHIGILSDGKLMYDGLNFSNHFECVVENVYLTGSLQNSISKMDFQSLVLKDKTYLYFKTEEDKEKFESIADNISFEKYSINKFNLESLYIRYAN